MLVKPKWRLTAALVRSNILLELFRGLHMFVSDRSLNPGITHRPYTLESLVAWLETMQATEIYCYESNGGCLVARYLADHGHQQLNVGSASIFFSPPNGGHKFMNMPNGWNAIAVQEPRTFGSALLRARSYLDAQRVK